MSLSMKLRLERVIERLANRATDDWNSAQSQDQTMHYHLIGWSGGGRNAIKEIKDEFKDILDSEFFDEPEFLRDNPVEPFSYIDNNKVLFRDTHNRYFFWDETFTNAHGPYDNIVEACVQLRLYQKEI